MKEPSFYIQLVRLLGFLPRNIALYKLAFQPKSLNRTSQPQNSLNNERLEFLGDAILDAIVAWYLFRQFPDGDEGQLTKLRSRIVKRKTLDHLARQIDIPSLIQSGVLPGNASKHVYGNTLEALIGAIYLDRGFRKARRFFARRIMKKHIDLVQLVRKDPDFKSRIIEWAQKHRVEVLFESTEEHKSNEKGPAFVSSILLNGEQKGTGRGSTKKSAEQRAAREALTSIKESLWP